MLASGDFADFRPVLQALSVAARGERIYDVGPWDEMSLWLFGPAAMDLPLRPRKRRSISFAHTGHHVLRGNDEDTFAAFRCGTIIDRFSQIDMLHVDIWWRGHNVLVDGGSYRYNGASAWHNHFCRTDSHNTIKLDGRDQMVHFRQFKNLYWTEAKLLRFEENALWAVSEGEHYGYERNRRCTHRRAVLFVRDGLWIVVDSLLGSGTHKFELQWLGGVFPWKFEAAKAQMTLHTPAGPFYVTMFDERGAALPGTTVAEGQEQPIRGWQSRYYGFKTPVPSMVGEETVSLPATFVSALSDAPVRVSVDGAEWTFQTDATEVRFRIREGRFDAINVVNAPELRDDNMQSAATRT
jgi:asparagine synthase (glutamine-hydrolysing)